MQGITGREVIAAVVAALIAAAAVYYAGRSIAPLHAPTVTASTAIPVSESPSASHTSPAATIASPQPAASGAASTRGGVRGGAGGGGVAASQTAAQPGTRPASSGGATRAGASTRMELREARVEVVEASSLTEAVRGLGPVATPTQLPVTMTVAAVRGGVESRIAGVSLTQGPGGSLVEAPGVDELNTVKVVGDTLYYARGGLVYRVDLASREPLDPIDALRDARLAWGWASIRVRLPGGSIVSWNASLTPALRGLVYLGGGLIAAVYSVYGLPGLGAYTGIIVYNGSRAVCSVLAPGSLVDARGADGLLWLATATPVYRVIVVGARSSEPILPARTPPPPRPPIWPPAERPATYITVLNASACRAWRLPLPGGLRVLLLVYPGGRDALLAVSGWGPSGPETVVAALELRSGSLRVEGVKRLRGLLPPNWLAAARLGDYTLLVLEEPGGGFRVYTLRGNLSVAGELAVPELRERVPAILMLGDKLYIVTYRQVDPLFTIDLSDPTHPKLLGWRKGPGYDELLYPLNASLVIGLGYEDSRLRITLYHVETNASLTPIDKLLLPRDVRAFTLASPARYRLLVVVDDAVAYPVVVVSGWKRAVLAVSIEHGKITDYKLFEGTRAAPWDHKLLILDDVVKLVDARTLHEIAEIRLAP